MPTLSHRPQRSPAVIAVAALLVGAAGTAHADDINNVNLLTQSEFRQLSEDAASALSFKPMIPSEGSGLTGFDFGVSATGTDLQHRDVWRKATAGGDVPSVLPVTSLRLHKGLPYDIDLGLSYSTVPSTNVRTVGGEVRWAFIAGSTVMPAVAVRLSASRMSGVDQMKLSTTGVDLSVSKGFAFLTPYAGIGRVESKTSAPGVPTLSGESFGQTKVFAGVNMSLGLLNLLVEGDKTGDASSYGVKLGLRF